MDAAAVHEAKIRDGWVLYYSEEGYPYYYNDSTGESEWAPYGEETANYAYYVSTSCHHCAHAHSKAIADRSW